MIFQNSRSHHPNGRTMPCQQLYFLDKKALVDAGYTDIPVISISVGSDIDNDQRVQGQLDESSTDNFSCRFV